MTWSSRLLTRAAAIALVALSAGAVAGWWVSHERPPQDEASRSAGPEVMALLAPLAIGSPLGAFTITSVGPVERGVIRVGLARGGRHAYLGIALAGSVPSRVGPYSIFYFGSDDPDLAEAVARLSEVLRTHLSAPVPAGLAPMH